MEYIYFIFLHVLSISVVIECELQCEYTPYEDAGVWLKYHKEPADWDTAQLQCAAEGALLASPIANLTSILNDIARTFAPTPVFTGIRIFYFIGSYVSVEGNSHIKIPQSWVTAKGRAEIIENGKVRCMILNQNGEIEHVECNQLYPYICYKSYEKVQRSCEAGYTLTTSRDSCHKLHSDKLTHDNAEEVCVQEGGHLLVINSEAEKEDIKTLIKQASKSTYHSRIGFRKANDTWITVNGKTLEEEGFSQFGPGEPSNTGGIEDCGSVQRDSVLLNDIPCNTTNSNFICEKTPHCVHEESKINIF